MATSDQVRSESAVAVLRATIAVAELEAQQRRARLREEEEETSRRLHWWREDERDAGNAASDVLEL